MDKIDFKILKDYMKFRWFYTSAGRLILMGKNAQSNENLILNYTKPHTTIIHTSEKGSPFAVITDIIKEEYNLK